MINDSDRINYLEERVREIRTSNRSFEEIVADVFRYETARKSIDYAMQQARLLRNAPQHSE